MTYTKTWRHSVSIEAKDDDEARQIWEGLNLGELDKATKKGIIESHNFVEDVSFEDEDYRDIEED